MRVRKFNLYAVFFMVVMFLAMPMTAHADSVYIESMNITVETKETPTKTLVQDKRRVLSDEEIQQIRAAGERLNVYDIGLYIEMTEKASCTQEYANQLAEQKFDEMLSPDNSIMIVFSFYEDSEGYYAVHYNVQGNLSESTINQIIQGSYHDFKTDSTWITGSFEKVVDYLTEVEYNLIHADEIAEQNKEMLITLGKIFRVMLEIFAIVAIIYLAWELKKQDKDWRAYTDKKDKKIDALIHEAKRQDSAREKLKARCDTLQGWKDNAIASTPEIEARITEYLAKKHAREFDKNYKKAEGVEVLSSMISEYDAMSAREKALVKLDIAKARQKLDELTKEEAKRASKVIEDACRQSADRHHRDSYNNAMNYYNGLPTAVKVLIAAQLISRLNNNHSAAQSDYHRHQSSYSSSYSHHHSSSSFSTGGFHSGTFGGGFGGGH